MTRSRPRSDCRRASNAEAKIPWSRHAALRHARPPRRNRMERKRQAHRPHRHSVDRGGRAQGGGLPGALQGRDVRQGVHEPASARPTDLRARRIWRRAKIDPDLLEWNYGDYEGRKTSEILAERPGWLLFRDGCPNGEQPADVAARADRVIARLRERDDRAIVFSSGHILRVLAARWLGLPPSEGRLFMLSTASVSVLGYEHDKNAPAIQFGTRGLRPWMARLWQRPAVAVSR